MVLEQAPLGKQSAYIDQYQPNLLFPIPRAQKRNEIGILEQKLPFQGADLWTGYELSWLNLKGKPVCVVADFVMPCNSPNLIESKSFKLYLNSYNNTRFASKEMVLAHLQKDLSNAVGMKVGVEFFDIDKFSFSFGEFTGLCLDHLDIAITDYQVKPEYITVADNKLSEQLYSHLLKSNCLVTGQPDWGSIWIDYEGAQIDREGLLRYIISFRNHNEFHEQCVERVFMDLMAYAKPQKLSVYARYTRRGGLDINPFRSTHEDMPAMRDRLARQ